VELVRLRGWTVKEPWVPGSVSHFSCPDMEARLPVFQGIFFFWVVAFYDQGIKRGSLKLQEPNGDQQEPLES
jgi:hypothetical protein